MCLFVWHGIDASGVPQQSSGVTEIINRGDQLACMFLFTFPCLCVLTLERKYERCDYHTKRKHIIYDFCVMNPKTALSLGWLKRLVLNMTFALNGLGKKSSFWRRDLFCKLSAWFTVILNSLGGGARGTAAESNFVSPTVFSITKVTWT